MKYLFTSILFTCCSLFSGWVANAQNNAHAFIIASANPDETEIGKYYGLQNENLHYDDLTAPIMKDTQTFSTILTRSGFGKNQITVMSGFLSKYDIIKKITEVAANLDDSGLFILYFTGHGQQIKDLNNDEIDDNLDESLVLTNELWIDDEINNLFSTTLSRFKNVFIADACYTGSAYKFFGVKTVLQRQMESSLKDLVDEWASPASTYLSGCPAFSINPAVKISLLYLGSSGDTEASKAENEGSWLSRHLGLLALNDGFQFFTFPDLYCRLFNLAENQLCSFRPVYAEIGNVSSYNHKQPLKLTK